MRSRGAGERVILHRALWFCSETEQALVCLVCSVKRRGKGSLASPRPLQTFAVPEGFLKTSLAQSSVNYLSKVFSQSCFFSPPSSLLRHCSPSSLFCIRLCSSVLCRVALRPSPVWPLRSLISLSASSSPRFIRVLLSRRFSSVEVSRLRDRFGNVRSAVTRCPRLSDAKDVSESCINIAQSRRRSFSVRWWITAISRCYIKCHPGIFASSYAC